MNTIVEGSGKPLLFLHGYLSSKESFYYQIKYFSRWFTVYAPDLSGFKENDLPYAYSLSDYAAETAKLIDEILRRSGEKSLSVVAHSFGARIVFKLSPYGKIDKLVLTGAAGIKLRKKPSVIFKILLYKSIKRLFHKEIESLGSADYRRLSPVMKESFKKIIAEDLTERIRSVSARTLIINGRLDKETPPKTAKALNDRIASSELVFIENAGHFCFIDRPDIFNLTVKEFLL